MWSAIVAGLKALAAAFGFGEKVTAEVHDQHQRDAGAAAQQSADKDAVIASQQRQAEAGVNAPKTTEEVVASMKDGSF